MAYRIEQTGAELQGILNDAAVTKQGLEDEVARAQAAEGGLQENIDSEAGERQSADALLAGNIGTEVARAQQAESDLGARVDANAAGVAAEVARAQEAEGQVWDTLNDEILTRQSQDAALQGNIEREAGLREAGDGQLQGEIDAISGKIPAEASEMNQLADKQYVQDAIGDAPTREEVEEIKAVIPAAASESNKLVDTATFDDVASTVATLQGLYAELRDGKADKAATLAGYGIEDAYTKGAVDEMIGALSRNEIVVGALPQAGEEGVIYRVPGNGYYTDYMYYDGEFVELSQYSMEFDQTQVGYFTCDTEAGTAAKTVSAAGYTLAVGGSMHIKMTNANTAANATLNINGTGVKALFYNDEQASASNSWENGEVVTVFYDGTRFMASNSQGGEAEKIKYDNSQSGLTAQNVQGALDEVGNSKMKIDAYLYGDMRTLAVGQIYEDNESVQTADKQLLKMPKSVTEMNLTDEIVTGDLKVYNGGTYKASKNVKVYTGNDSEYNEGDYALGSYSEYTITVTAGNSAGNIIINNESIEITDGETAAEIAASIVENIIIDGWTLFSEDDTVTVKCRTIGANTTSITFDDGDTGVTLSGISTPSSTGTNVLRVYASGSWNNAVLSDYAASSVWGEALTLTQLQEEAVQNHVPKLYDDYGQNKDGAITQKALNDISDERDEVVMQALLDLDERSGGGGSAGNALNYTKKNFYVFGASIEAIARIGNPGKTAESLIPTAPTGWVTYFKQAPYVKEVYIYAAAAGAYATCTGSATFTLDYDIGNNARNIYWNQFNLAIYNYLKGTVPAPDVIIISTGGNDIQWQSNRNFQTIFSQTADDVFGTNLNAFTFTKYADADILSENISPAEVRTKCLTFASCWRYYVEMIYSYWPDTQIIFYGNGYTRGGDIPRNEVENTFNRQNDLAEDCCRKMGLPIIRGDYEGNRWNVYEMVKHIAAGGSPDDDYIEGKNHPWGWTYDGYHTTSEGAKMLGEYMISKVGSLLRYRYNV